jgi:lipopolysaccharide/colanic/teichoic acid biosynthesis glycosyltransferase
LIKRLVDILVALVALIIFLPFGILFAILIKLTSPGPVFFIQDRPGLNRKIFKVIKFRTMRLGSEKMIKGEEVMLDDERITAIGRVLRRGKIDEIPQVLNVLKGEMSIVGPRPERVDSLEDYTPTIAHRLDMRPGITGLAQVSGNIYLELQDRYRYDVYYVDHFTVGLDFRIIFRTVGVVLRGEEKYLGRPLVQLPELTDPA